MDKEFSGQTIIVTGANGEDDTLTIKIDVVPEDLKEKAREAARLCPRQAITFEE